MSQKQHEFGGEHFKALPSYPTYVTLGDMAEATGGFNQAYKDYIGTNLIGTHAERWDQR
jgi:hypothetical protein